jgi:hypothetical protein
MSYAFSMRLAAIPLVLALAACGQNPQQGAASGPPAPAVSVAQPIERGVID